MAPPGATRAAAQSNATPLRFPRDAGAHPDFQTEWWYATGWLSTPERPAEPTHGFQITFFRSRTEVAADHPSAFAAKQLVFAHVALTDLAERRQRQSPSAEAPAL